MGHNSRPQKQPNGCTANADANEVQHGERAVGQHSVQRLVGGISRPAGDTEADQGYASDAAHHYADAIDVYTEQ